MLTVASVTENVGSVSSALTATGGTMPIIIAKHKSREIIRFSISDYLDSALYFVNYNISSNFSKCNPLMNIL